MVCVADSTRPRTPTRVFSDEHTKTHTPVARGVISPHRYYNPALGRWISRDSIGEDGGLHLYAYGLNSPAQHIDPLGNVSVYVGSFGSGGMDQAWDMLSGSIIVSLARLGAQIGDKYKDVYDEPCELRALKRMTKKRMSRFVHRGGVSDSATGPDYGCLWTKYMGSRAAGGIIGIEEKKDVMAAKRPRCSLYWAGSHVKTALTRLGAGNEAWIRPQDGPQPSRISALYMLDAVKNIFNAYKCCRTRKSDGKSFILRLERVGFRFELKEGEIVREHPAYLTAHFDKCEKCPKEDGGFKCKL